jgi:hypothetical protein
MSGELPKSVWSGTFMIGDLAMRCHVLEDGQRIIEAESMQRFFERFSEFEPEELIEFVRWSRGQPA